MPPRKKTLATESTTTNDVTVSAVTIEDKPVKAKREKKTTKHKVVAVITPDGIQGSFQVEQKRPLIAQLPIHSSEILFHDQPFTYDPTPPGALEGYDAGEINPFAEEATYENIPQDKLDRNDNDDEYNNDANNSKAHQTSTVSVVSSSHTNTTTNTHTNTTTQSNGVTSQRKEYGPQKLLVCNQSTKITHELPSTTQVACFWCCEHFQNRPCVIPISINESIWNVYGNFCTPNCAMAYLLSESMDTHTRWERIALLNRLYSTSVNGRVYPAPSRETLERFGGPIHPADFHHICEAKQIRVDTFMPPMVSILASMDTKPIDFYETTIQNSFTTNYQSILASKPNVESASSTLKLKRSKPLKDKESTLDVCLQIKSK